MARGQKENLDWEQDVLSRRGRTRFWFVPQTRILEAGGNTRMDKADKGTPGREKESAGSAGLNRDWFIPPVRNREVKETWLEKEKGARKRAPDRRD